MFDGVSWVHGYKSTLHLVLDWLGSVIGKMFKLFAQNTKIVKDNMRWVSASWDRFPSG